MFKDELNGNVMTEFVALPSKLYAFLDDKDKCEKKAKGVKKCVIKKVLKFDNYKYSLLSKKTIRTTQQRFKYDHHIITTEKTNKIALSRKDDKRLQLFDGIHIYLYVIDKDLLNELESKIKNEPIQMYY